jgi:hypothetical protein
MSFFSRFIRLKLSFAVKVDADFRFGIGIAGGAMRLDRRNADMAQCGLLT